MYWTLAKMSKIVEIHENRAIRDTKNRKGTHGTRRICIKLMANSRKITQIDAKLENETKNDKQISQTFKERSKTRSESENLVKSTISVNSVRVPPLHV